MAILLFDKIDMAPNPMVGLVHEMEEAGHIPQFAPQSSAVLEANRIKSAYRLPHREETIDVFLECLGSRCRTSR